MVCDSLFQDTVKLISHHFKIKFLSFVFLKDTMLLNKAGGQTAKWFGLLMQEDKLYRIKKVSLSLNLETWEELQKKCSLFEAITFLL